MDHTFDLERAEPDEFQFGGGAGFLHAQIGAEALGGHEYVVIRPVVIDELQCISDLGVDDRRQ